MQSLAGVLSDGTPRGLSRCRACADWQGVCLDPSAQFAGQVMTVHCYCDNHNRCARCNERLYERRLNANYYNPEERLIWHVPGCCGLSHLEPSLPGWRALTMEGALTSLLEFDSHRRLASSKRR
jgi:hypothetical protein